MSIASTIRCRPTHLAPLGWLALQAAALWPHAAWMAHRVQDGSDDPLGLAALLALAVLLARAAPTLRVSPHTGWLGAAAALTAASAAAVVVLPPLAAALVAALALAASLMAWLPEHAPRAPLAGLVVLALPLIASLQYYAGFPLRVLTAHLSAWLLMVGGVDARPLGASMTVDGQLVLVDAPCSGVQMVWMAYFCACAFAAVRGLRDGAFLRRLPFVGLRGRAGNVVRNTLLVALEARPQGLDPLVHQGIGLVALGAVCAAVVVMLNGGRDARR